MKISPIQIELMDITKRNERTVLLAILNFDTLWHSSSLFEIGYFEGYFYLEILFSNYIINKLKDWFGR